MTISTASRIAIAMTIFTFSSLYIFQVRSKYFFFAVYLLFFVLENDK